MWYFIIGIIFGILYFTVFSLNQIFQWTESIILNIIPVYDNDDNDDDLFIKLLVGLLMSLLIILIWPVGVTTTLFYLIIIYFKKLVPLIKTYFK